MGCQIISRKQKCTQKEQKDLTLEDHLPKNCESMNIISSNLNSKSVAQPLSTPHDLKTLSQEQKEYLTKQKQLLNSLFVNIREELEQQDVNQSRTNQNIEIHACHYKPSYELRLIQLQKLNSESDQSIYNSKKKTARHIFKQYNQERFKNLQLIF
ncbi:hypothetical protein pb186bvf_002769 [Paramecium bursaria]